MPRRSRTTPARVGVRPRCTGLCSSGYTRLQPGSTTLGCSLEAPHWVAAQRRGGPAHSTAQHSTAQHGTARHGTARHGTAPHGTARQGTARHRTARQGTARHRIARHGTARHLGGARLEDRVDVGVVELLEGRVVRLVDEDVVRASLEHRVDLLTVLRRSWCVGAAVAQPVVGAIGVHGSLQPELLVGALHHLRLVGVARHDAEDLSGRSRGVGRGGEQVSGQVGRQ